MEGDEEVGGYVNVSELLKFLTLESGETQHGRCVWDDGTDLLHAATRQIQEDLPLTITVSRLVSFRVLRYLPLPLTMTEVFTNTYSPIVPSIAPDVHLHTPPSEYDFNFVFPVQLLRSDRIELRPFVVSSLPHSQLWFPRSPARVNSPHYTLD